MTLQGVPLKGPAEGFEGFRTCVRTVVQKLKSLYMDLLRYMKARKGRRGKPAGAYLC